jgi:hypothetical protein
MALPESKAKIVLEGARHRLPIKFNRTLGISISPLARQGKGRRCHDFRLDPNLVLHEYHRSMRRSQRGFPWGFCLAVAVLCGCVYGCGYLPLDGSIGIDGSIVSKSGEPVEGCTLYLLYPTGRERKMKVDSVFSTGFTISPPAKDYTLKVSCPGYTTPYVSKSFRHSGSDDEPDVDLGVIVMQ